MKNAALTEQLTAYLADVKDAHASENGASERYRWSNRDNPCREFSDVSPRHSELLSQSEDLKARSGLVGPDVCFDFHDASMDNLSVRRSHQGYHHTATVDAFQYDRVEESSSLSHWRENDKKKRFTVSFTAPKSLRAELSGSVFYDFVLAASHSEATAPDHLAALVWKKAKDGSVRMVDVASEISEWSVEPVRVPRLKM